MTLDDIVRRCGRRFPDKRAVLADDLRYTWLELDQRVDRVAAALGASGLTPGDRVGILLGNRPEYLEIYFGCSRAGVIAVPINYRLTPREMDQILRHADARLIIFDREFAQTIDIGSEVPKLRWQIGHGEEDDYVRAIEAAPGASVESPACEDDTFAIFFTSGTTGPPKGAMVSHRNLIANGYNQMIADASCSDDINLVSSPLYHMGAVFMATTYMMLGCTQVVMRTFQPLAWLRHVQDHRASVALLIPTMINAILNEPGKKDFDTSSLRRIFYGGGPMPPAVLERALRFFPCGFTQGYGLTETLEATFLLAADHVLDGSADQTRRLASAGREAVGADVRIVGPESDVLPAGEIGEILIRSPSVIRGYWRQPEATESAIRDGWFHTGDLGYLDDARYLFVVDRLKDMVVSGGVNIYTKEIESVLYEHAAVREAAVYGLPDENWGERVVASVVLCDGVNVSEADLIAHCRSLLASYKKPRQVFFEEELPKNPSGKILKRELRTLHAQ